MIEVAEAWVVVDGEGNRLSFSYFDETPRGANSTRMLKPDVRKLADAIAMLPDLSEGAAASPAPGIPSRGPWIAEDRGSWFTVREAAGVMVAAVYVDRQTAGSLNWDEAIRIANGIAKLPDYMTAGKLSFPKAATS